MHRPLALALILALAPTAAAAEYDADTLAGMDAAVRGDWLAAIEAFARAREKEPEDPARETRLAEARTAAGEYFRDAAKELAKNGAGPTAAECAAIAARIDPDAQGLVTVMGKLKAEDIEVPADLKIAPAPRRYPGRSVYGRIRAGRALGAAWVEAVRIGDAARYWLVKHQGLDGRWSSGKYGGYDLYDVGVTGLALLALLVHGPDGLQDSAGTAAGRAADWLAKTQDDEGCFGPRASSHFTYIHAIATMALAEYAALTGGEERFHPVLKQAGEFILRCQNPYRGWRYGVRPADNDVSVTYWMVSALYRLRRAGLPVEQERMQWGVDFVATATDPKTGATGYTSRSTGSARPTDMLDRFPSDKTLALTAAACVIRRYAGVPSQAVDARQARMIRELKPLPALPDMYYWYAGARALVTETGTVPADWYKELLLGVRAHRATDGSIDPAGPWGLDGGRVYSTAVTALALICPVSETSCVPPGRAADFLTLGTRTLTVPATATCRATGIWLEPGMTVHVTPEGEVFSYPGAEKSGPDGHKKTPHGRDRVTSRGPYGCLLGRIGEDGKPFALKKETTVRPHGEWGPLFLRMNDEHPDEAWGELTVRIELLKE